MITDLLNPLFTRPEFSVIGMVTISALAPLSMVARMPGKYYRCQPAPTNEMLYGLLENALGWHIAQNERDHIMKRLIKLHGEPASTSGVSYRSLLQYHVRIGIGLLPAVIHYNDLWSQHLHGASFASGSREHGYEAIPLMNALAGKQIQVNDRAEAGKAPNLITDFEAGQTIHLNVLRPYFPQFYVSPTMREYVVPQGEYCYRVETSPAFASLLADAIENPAAPLYLGSNDGWVEVEWKQLS